MKAINSDIVNDIQSRTVKNPGKPITINSVEFTPFAFHGDVRWVYRDGDRDFWQVDTDDVIGFLRHADYHLWCAETYCTPAPVYFWADGEPCPLLNPLDSGDPVTVQDYDACFESFIECCGDDDEAMGYAGCQVRYYHNDEIIYEYDEDDIIAMRELRG